MELLLKRNETATTFGKRYDLFAKLELKPEELARVRKAQPEKTLLWQDEGSKSQSRWRLCLIPGGIAALLFHPILALPVMVIAWFPLTKLFFNQVRPAITVADIITGRTIHCNRMSKSGRLGSIFLPEIWPSGTSASLFSWHCARW